MLNKSEMKYLMHLGAELYKFSEFLVSIRQELMMGETESENIKSQIFLLDLIQEEYFRKMEDFYESYDEEE